MSESRFSGPVPKPPPPANGWLARSLHPEILDTLAADDPLAVRSRRDLRIINRFMGTPGWFARQLASIPPADRTIHEIGAGDGSLARHLAAKVPVKSWTGFDLVPAPTDWPDDWAWQAGDCFQDPELCAAPVLVANLVLHHFDDNTLAKLGQRIREGEVRYLVVSEPARHKRHVRALQLGRLVGFSPVTLHDGAVSIAAGFWAAELSKTLGLSKQEWEWRCQLPFTGAYRMMARRL